VTVDVKHEPERRRFLAVVDGTESFLQYAPLPGEAVDFRSTFVDPAVRHRGIGEAIVRHAVAWARGSGLSIVPTCWFVSRWLEREAAHEARASRRAHSEETGA
jgi:predicted GNAT family acetyltransferase